MLLVYCALALLPEAARTQRNLMAMILLTLSVFTVLSYGNIFVRERNLCLMIAGFLIAGILFNIAYQYSYEKDYLSEFTDSGEALEKLETGVDLAVLDTRDDSIYRYDQMDASSSENSSMQMGTNSTAYYFSVASSSIANFFDEMYLNTPWEQHYDNLDGRTILDRLASVKYFVVQKEKKPICRMAIPGFVGRQRKKAKPIWPMQMRMPCRLDIPMIPGYQKKITVKCL